MTRGAGLTVDYVDCQRGKLGVTGAVEGHGTVKSLQIFFRSDIKKIVVFDENPAVFAQIPSPALPPPVCPRSMDSDEDQCQGQDDNGNMDNSRKMKQ